MAPRVSLSKIERTTGVTNQDRAKRVNYLAWRFASPDYLSMLLMGNHQIADGKKTVYLDESTRVDHIVPLFADNAPWLKGPRGFEQMKDLRLRDGSVLRVANIVLYRDRKSAVILSMDLLSRIPGEVAQ